MVLGLHGLIFPSKNQQVKAQMGSYMGCCGITYVGASTDDPDPWPMYLAQIEDASNCLARATHEGASQKSSILVRDTMVPIYCKIISSLWGIVFYTRTIIP